MSRKSVFTSCILLFALVAVSILLNQGLVRAFANGSGMSLEADASTYIIGETVRLTGTVDISADDVAYIQQVTLIVDGPDSQDLDVALPLEEATALVLLGDPGATGYLLEVTVEFANLLPLGSTLPNGTLPGSTLPNSTLPNGTLPNGTLPNGTLPDTSCQLLGDTGSDLAQYEVVGDHGTITYSIDWIPSAAGNYQGHLVVTSISADGCTTTSSEPVEFSVSIEPPPNPGDDKVTICHIPPGNPAKARLITVGIPAVPAHMRHGDLITGYCDVAEKIKKHDRHPGHDEHSDDDDDENDDGNGDELDDDGDKRPKNKGKKSGNSPKYTYKFQYKYESKDKKSDNDYDKKPKNKGKKSGNGSQYTYKFKYKYESKDNKSDDDGDKKPNNKGKKSGNSPKYTYKFQYKYESDDKKSDDYDKKPKNKDKKSGNGSQYTYKFQYKYESKDNKSDDDGDKKPKNKGKRKK